MKLQKLLSLKKINALLALLAVVLLLDHTVFLWGWSGIKKVFSLNIPTTSLLLWIVALHAILSIYMLFFKHDGISKKYAKLNYKTYIQRLSGIVLFVLVLWHTAPFAVFPAGILWIRKWFYILLFFTALIHISVSFSKLLITLGWLGSERAVRYIDLATQIICAIILIVSVVSLGIV